MDKLISYPIYRYAINISPLLYGKVKVKGENGAWGGLFGPRKIDISRPRPPFRMVISRTVVVWDGFRTSSWLADAIRTRRSSAFFDETV